MAAEQLELPDVVGGNVKFLIKLNIGLPCNSRVSLLFKINESLCSKEPYSRMFVTALFMIAGQ